MLKYGGLIKVFTTWSGREDEVFCREVFLSAKRNLKRMPIYLDVPYAGQKWMSIILRIWFAKITTVLILQGLDT